MKNSDQQAFPSQFQTETLKGLTKREYFAGIALQGLLSQHFTKQSQFLMQEDEEDYLMAPVYLSPYIEADEYGQQHTRESLCRDALKIADEILKQLSR